MRRASVLVTGLSGLIGGALLRHPGHRADVFFVLSDNPRSDRDLTHPREVLGFRPLDRAEARGASR